MEVLINVEVMDMQKICRTCLSESDDLESVFEDSEDALTICAKIASFTKTKVNYQCP